MNKKWINFTYLLSLCTLSLVFGCASRATLGTRDHIFSDKGKHIIWFQIEGLLSDHLPLIKYTSEKASESLAFEKMACSANLWSHNLYELRPKPDLGFIGQILGSQNIKGNCTDIDREPVWKFFQEKGYEVAIMESSSMGKKSLSRYESCTEKVDLFEDAYVWKREKAPKKDVSFFHYLDSQAGLETPGVYYDKSCQERGCFVSLQVNVRSMWKHFKEKNAKTFTVIRDSSYADQINAGDIEGAMETLAQWNKYLSEVIEEANGKSVTLLVTTSAGRVIEFPKKGRQWARFMKKGKGIVLKNQSLTADAWAYGPGAENFCGTYEEDQIFSKILWAPEKRFIDELL